MRERYHHSSSVGVFGKTFLKYVSKYGNVEETREESNLRLWSNNKLNEIR